MGIIQVDLTLRRQNAGEPRDPFDQPRGIALLDVAERACGVSESPTTGTATYAGSSRILTTAKSLFSVQKRSPLNAECFCGNEAVARAISHFDLLGTATTVSLGKITPESAKNRAKAILGQVAHGRDPAAQRAF